MFVGHIISMSLSICLWSISTFFQSISRFSWSCWLPSHLCGSFVQNTPNFCWRQWHQKRFKRILQKHKYELGKPIDNQQCKQYTLHSQDENKYDIEIHRVLPHHTWPLSDHQTFSYIYILHYIHTYIYIYITYIYIYTIILIILRNSPKFSALQDLPVVRQMLTKAKEVERWQRWQRQSCLVRNVKNHISSLEKICHAFFDILSVFQVLDLSIVDQNQTQYPIWQIWQGWSTAAGYNEKQFWVGTKDKGGKGRERWEPKQPLQSFPLFFLDESVQNLMGHQNCLNLSRLFGQILGYDLEDVIAKGPEEKLEAQEAPGDPYSLTFYDLCASTQLTSYIPVVTNLGHPNHPNPTLPRVLSAKVAMFVPWSPPGPPGPPAPHFLPGCPKQSTVNLPCALGLGAPESSPRWSPDPNDTTEDAKKHSDLQSGSRPQDGRRGPPRNCAFSADGAQDLAVESTVVAGHTAWAHLGCLPSLATRLKKDVNVNTYFKTLFAAYCIYFENIQTTSTSNLHPIYIQSICLVLLFLCFTESLLNFYWMFTFFFLAKSPGHVELACSFLRWSYFLFLCSSSWSFALWVWSPASYVRVHCPLAVAVCIPGDSPSPGRRTSIRRSSTWRTTSRIEAYHAHRYIPNLCRWTIWSPKRNLRVLDVLGFNKAVGSCCFFLVLWVDWTGYRSTTDVDAWQTLNMFKFQIKVSVRKEYLDYGLNIQVPKGGEDQFLKLLGIRWKLLTLDVQSSCAYDTSLSLWSW